ncbi:MAG: phosphatidylserine decarboxylase [Sandaracinaceae bacterium]|nr:phosphatidylserine decarboxylase [Sandaracinaceae bacterium]
MPSLATRVAAETLRLLPRKRISRSLGQLASRAPGRRVLERAIAAYVDAYDVDLSDAVVPADGFRTFDEFFTRALVEGARPLEGDERTLACPADGRVEDAGPITPGARFLVKGREYSADELLAEDASRFTGGRFAIVYLSPRDYHRVHAPASGPVHTLRHVGGTLLPVNAFGVASYPNLFARNERVVAFQRAAAGEVATVLVGAIGVGRISVRFEPSVMTNVGRGPTTLRYEASSAPVLARGDELGTFHLGSTAIVLTAPELACELRVSAGDRVRVGRALAQVGGAP